MSKRQNVPVSFADPGPYPGREIDVPLDQVYVPVEKYQRSQDERDIQGLALDFHWVSYDRIHVYETNGARPGYRYEVDQGGKRTMAAKLMKLRTLPAVVYPITDEQAAEAFSQSSKHTKKLTDYDIFHAGLFKNADPNAVKLNEIVTRCGFQVVPTAKPKSLIALRAIKTLMKIVKQVEWEGLEEVLLFAKETWPHDPKRTDGALLSGIQMLLAVYGHKITPEARQRLSGCSVSWVLSEAQGLQQSTRSTKVAAKLREVTKLRKIPKAKF